MMNISDNKIRFYIYTIALLPFVLLMVSGVILLKYHTGAPPESTVLELDGHFWMSFHKATAIISVPLIFLHLFVKTDWVKRFFAFNPKRAFKTSNIILFILFLLCVFTGFGSGAILDKLGGIHNKLGLFLIVMFALHLWNYRKVIFSRFKNEFKANAKNLNHGQPTN